MSELVKYDYRALIEKCMTNRGQFADGELFDKIRADDISFLKGYRAVLGFCVHIENSRHYCYYGIQISQDGAEIVDVKISPKNKFCEYIITVMNDAVPRLLEVLKELDCFKFTPLSYELWSDNPDTPYYLPDDGINSLCDTVIKINKED